MLSKKSKKSKKNKLNDNSNDIVVVGIGGSTSIDVTNGEQLTNNNNNVTIIQSSSDTKKPLKESKKSTSSSNTRKISTSSSTTPTLNRRFNDFIELIRHRFNNTTNSSSSSKRHSKKQRSKQQQHVDNQLTTQTSKQDNNNLDINDDNNNLSTLTCQLCCNEYETNESFFHLNTCKHQFCINCLRTYLKYQISESRTAISCPKCQEKMQQSDIYHLLTDYNRTLIDKYEEFMIRRVLLTIPDVRFCPAPDCTYAIIASGCANCPQLQCERPGCNTSFCYHCKQLWHPNLTCEDAARLNPFGSSATSSATAAAILGLNRSNSHISIASYALVSGNSSQQKDEMKFCPKCRSPIVKMDDGSCNHMTCPVCGCEFCWLCMKEISDLHYLSPSGCTFWGKKPWSRKKKILWQLGTLIGAPVGIALVASVAIPAIIIGLPIWSGRKVYLRFKNSNKHKRNIIVVTTVVGSILVAPIIAALTVGIGVPILLAYVYGVVPISLCRSGGCGVTTNENGGVRLSFDDQDTITFSNTNNNLMNNLPTNTATTTTAIASSSGGPSTTSATTTTFTTTTSTTNNRISLIPQQQQQSKTVTDSSSSPTTTKNVNSNPVVPSSSTATTTSTTSANSKCVDLINNMATVSASIQTDFSKDCNINMNSTRCSNDVSNKCKITSKSKASSSTTTPPPPPTTTTPNNFYTNNQQYHKFSSSCGSVLSETDKIVTLKHNNNYKNDSHSVNTQNNPSSIGDASIGDRASVNTDRNEYFVYDVDLGDRDSASNKALAGSSKRITFKDNHDYRDMDDDDDDDDDDVDDDDGLTKKYDIKSYDSYSLTTTSEKSNNPSVIALAGSIKDNQSIKSADNNLDTTTTTTNQNNNNKSPTTHKTILITQVL